MSLTIKGATSGSVDVVAPASGSDVTLTLPTTTGTVLLTNGDGSSLSGVGVPGATGSASGLPTLQLDRTTTGSTQFVSQNSNSNGAMFQFNNDTSIQIHTRSSGTDTERLRILPGGGITFNGDSAAANALDDYEEGTFNPVFTGTSGSAGSSFDYSEHEGHYTKIGRLVTVHFKYTLINNGDWGGSVEFTGLPFTSGANFPHAGAVTLSNVNFNGYCAGITIPNGASTCRISMTTDNGATSDLSAGGVANNAAFRTTFSYFTS